MPQINRIRVNNIKYNFGTQFYDDFMMRFSGKNTIYDLANGGGKSVLMLLLLQNMIPNCTLDDKQPIEKLFRTEEGSNTIHSLVEWNLSDVHIKNNYKYMLTGFCARKAKEEERIRIVPLKMYMKGNHAKILIAVAKGKKLYDKREAIKKRDLEREQKEY